MKRVTFSADGNLIEKARAIARVQGRSLNLAFREWLLEFTSSEHDCDKFDALMNRLRHIDAGRRFTRDEMNDRHDHLTT